MNSRFVGLGLLLLVVALILGLYTSQNIVLQGQPGAESDVHMSPGQPYLPEALVLAVVGLVLVIAGLVTKRKRPANEREGSLGVDESEIRPSGPSRPPSPTP